MTRIDPDKTFTRLMLCRVIPSKESDVLRVLEEAGATEVLFALGEYDLIGIAHDLNFDRASRDEVLGRLASSVRDYQEVLCFKWHNCFKAISRSQPYPIWALSFFKMNSALLHDHDPGIDGEHDLAKWVHKQYPEKVPTVSATAMGSIGWPEIVVFWAGQKFSDVGRQIKRMRSLTWEEIVPNCHAEIKKQPVFASSYTVPGIPFESYEWRPGITANSGPDLVTLDRGNGIEGVEASLLLKSTQGQQDELAKTLAASLSNFENFDLHSVFGNYDFSLRHKTGKIPLDQLKLAILEARSIPVIQSTRTHLSFDAPTEKVVGQGQVISGPGTTSAQRDQSLFQPADTSGAAQTVQPAAGTTDKEDQKRFAIYLEWLDQLRRLENRIANPVVGAHAELTQIHSRFFVTKGIPEFTGLFDDMELFVRSVFVSLGRYLYDDAYFAWLDPYSRRRFDRYKHVTSTFELAFEQRLNGAHLGQVNSSRAVTALRSYGVQRVLRAANVVASQSLALMHGDNNRPFEWSGFVVFGYMYDRLHLPFGVVNLPRSALLQPEDWGLITHACGHEFFHLAKLENHLLVKRVSEQMSKLMGQQTVHYDAQYAHRKAAEIVEEVVADVFTYHIAHGQDWSDYVETIGKHLNLRFDGSPLSEDFVFHIVRLVFIYFYHLRWEGSLAKDHDTITEILQAGARLEELIFQAPLPNQGPFYVNPGPQYNLINRKLYELGTKVDELILNVINDQIKRHLPRCEMLLSQIDMQDLAILFVILEPLQLFLKGTMEKHLRSDLWTNKRIDKAAGKNLGEVKRNGKFMESRDIKKLAKELRSGKIQAKAEAVCLIRAAAICLKEDPAHTSPWAVTFVLSLEAQVGIRHQ
jgi:hypothetical protein